MLSKNITKIVTAAAVLSAPMLANAVGATHQSDEGMKFYGGIFATGNMFQKGELKFKDASMAMKGGKPPVTALIANGSSYTIAGGTSTNYKGAFKPANAGQKAPNNATSAKAAGTINSSGEYDLSGLTLDVKSGFGMAGGAMGGVMINNQFAVEAEFGYLMPMPMLKGDKATPKTPANAVTAEYVDSSATTTSSGAHTAVAPIEFTEILSNSEMSSDGKAVAEDFSQKLMKFAAPYGLVNFVGYIPMGGDDAKFKPFGSVGVGMSYMTIKFEDNEVKGEMRQSATSIGYDSKTPPSPEPVAKPDANAVETAQKTYAMPQMPYNKVLSSKDFTAKTLIVGQASAGASIEMGPAMLSIAYRFMMPFSKEFINDDNNNTSDKNTDTSDKKLEYSLKSHSLMISAKFMMN